MKNLIYLIIIFVSTSISAQTAFTVVELKIKSGQGGAVVKIVDDFMKDAKFKEGSGYNLERMWEGSGEFTHRLVWYGPLGKRGRVEGDMSEYENSAYWSSLRQYFMKTKAYSGRILDWKSGDNKQKELLIYDVIVKDPNSYSKAHKTILKKLGNSVFKDRTVAFGTYDIGRPNGATHWVVLSGNTRDDLLVMHRDLQEKHSKELTEYFTTRGEVIDLKDVRISRIAEYN